MATIFSLDRRIFFRPKPGAVPANDKGFSLPGTNGTTIMLIHGLTGTPNEMRAVANYLNKKGFSIVCPHLANHGEPIWVLKNTKWQDFYRSVRDVFIKGELARTKGPIFISGLSLGALLALVAADEFKDRVRGVSCLAPTLFYDGWNTPLSNYFMGFACTPLRHFFFFKEEPPYGIKNEAMQQRIHKYYGTALLDDMQDVAQYGYPYFPVSLLFQLQLLVKYLKKKLPRMHFPVQMIQAKDDDMTSVKNSKFIYDRIGSETKEIVLLYNSYHVITADQERDVVAEKMAGFFNRILEK